MGKTKIIFFDIKDYDKEFFKKYADNFNFDMTFLKGKLTEETVHLTKGYDVVCAFTNDVINKANIDVMANNGIKLLAMRCAGFNNVSLKDIHNRFKVVRVPAYSPHAIAEYTVALILAVNRKIHKAYVRTREGNFSINGLMGFDLNGKTAGIIGTGKIGQILIKILKGFNMKVIAYDLYPNQKAAEELGFEYVSLDELYAQSDIISLNCPLTKETQYMINRKSMLKMKDGVILVNTGRGMLIDSADLVEALKDKKIGAVALDVYEEEEDYFFEDKSTQVIEDDILGRLLSFYNVLLTSHQAYFTKETQYMINRKSMLKMKDGVILVNTGRGMLIDSADLVEALKDKKIGAVALDVYEEEEDYFFEDKSTQVIEDDILGRLLSFYNVLLTSHQAYFTQEAVDAITLTTLNNIKDFVEGKELVNEVPQS